MIRRLKTIFVAAVFAVPSSDAFAFDELDLGKSIAAAGDA